MKYSDGKEIKIGDFVDLDGEMRGIVVCSFDTQEFSSNFPSDEWNIYQKGIMVNSDKAGLIYYAEENPEMVLIKRAGD